MAIPAFAKQLRVPRRFGSAPPHLKNGGGRHRPHGLIESQRRSRLRGFAALRAPWRPCVSAFQVWTRMWSAGPPNIRAKETASGEGG